MKNDDSSGTESIAAVQGIEVFANLDTASCREIAEKIRWRQYSKGTEVVPHLGESDEVYFIASGRVRITIYSLSGKEISYQELGPGNMFGELSAIDQLPRTANVITAESSQLGTLSSTDFWHLIEHYPGIAEATLKRLAGLVRFLIDRVYQYGALDVKDRVRMEVLRLARENMTADDTATIPDFPTHKEIASRVNTHREAVTKELNELARMELIVQDHRVMAVRTVAGLSNLLSDDI